jgi:hypothetical protein
MGVKMGRQKIESTESFLKCLWYNLTPHQKEIVETIESLREGERFICQNARMLGKKSMLEALNDKTNS